MRQVRRADSKHSEAPEDRASHKHRLCVVFAFCQAAGAKSGAHVSAGG